MGETPDDDAMNDATLKTARDVVQSIYDTIVESAEEDDAHAKWLTADFRSGEMMYQVQLHSGVAGVGLFLADYGRILHDDRAVELAGKAMTWSQSAENAGFWTKNDSGAWRVTLAYGVTREPGSPSCVWRRRRTSRKPWNERWLLPTTCWPLTRHASRV